MSYTYALAYYESLNGDSYEVRIKHDAAGTDSTDEFYVGPQGAVIIYESNDDTLLVPGIVHSRCELTTIWPTSLNTKLDTLITELVDSEDGDFILEVKRDSDVIWFGTILVDQVTITDGSEMRTLSLRASDGLSLLENVPFNDAGTAYEGYYELMPDLMNEIMGKWVLNDYRNEITVSTDKKVCVADDVYNEDDQLYSLLTHPGGTEYTGWTRNRLNAAAWHTTNNQNELVYISTHDLLKSICITYQLRLYFYGLSWHFIPVNLADQTISGYCQLNSDVVTTNTISDSYSYQLSTVTNTRQKDREWARTFTPQLNKVRLNRDTNEGSEFLASYNTDNIVSTSISDIQIFGADTEPEGAGFQIGGNIFIANEDSGVTDSDRCGRFALRIKVEWRAGATSTFYTNTLTPFPTGRVDSHYFDGGTFDFAPVDEEDVGYVSTAGYYYYHPQESDTWYYDLNVDGQRYLPFVVNVPPPPTEQDSLFFSITPIVLDSYGNESTSLRLDLTTITIISAIVRYVGTDGLSGLPNFDYVASSTYGKGTYELGTTHIGDLPVGMGGIEVYDGTNWAVTNNWVCQSDSTTRNINVMACEETLAAHYKARALERGAIVLRGTSATPSKPFARFYDNDTGIYYTALNWVLRSSLCELDVTLRKLGRNATGITTNYETGNIPRDPTGGNQGNASGRPDPLAFSYNNRATSNFAGDWSAVIGAGETKEMYFTVANDGQGRYIDAQGDAPPLGYKIVRKTYVNTRGLQERTDSGWTSPAALQPADNETLSDCMELMQTYMNKIGDHGAYTFMVTYSEVANVPLLDEYSGATAAYGLRKLRNAYTGSAIQVRRTSPSAASQDIGFTALGELDVTALETFCGSGDGYIQKWYDQSGNGNDLVQASTANQPQIVASGLTIKLNNKPAMQLDGSNDSLPAATNFDANANVNELIVAWVGDVSSVSSGQNIVSHWNSSTGSQVFQTQMLATAAARAAHRYSNGTLATADASGSTANTQYIIISHTKQNKHEIYRNGTKTNGTNVNVAPNNATTSFRVGARSDNQGAPHGGKTQEVVVWSRATAADDPADISITLNDFYTAY